MTAPFEIEATVNGGPLDGRRMVVTVIQRGGLRTWPVIEAKVQIEDRMVPVDIARTVLAHTERSGT